MQKKLAVGVLALVSAAFCAVGFAACDKGGNDVGKDTDIGTVKSETVTEAQWKEVFKAENFNNFKAISKITFTGENSGSGTQEITVAGDKCYEKNVQGTLTSEYYYSVEGGKNYTYEQENSVWSRHESNHNMVSEYRSTFTVYGERYSDFEYSDSDKGYKLTQSEERDSYSYTLTIIVKITNGKLSGFISDNAATDHGENSTFHTEITVYDYGKASVTLPAVQSGDNEQGDDNDDNEQGGNQGGNEQETPVTGSEVNETQWKAALSASAFTNFTMDGLSAETDSEGEPTGLEQTVFLACDSANDKLKAASNGMTMCLSKEGSVYYYFEEDTEGCVRSVLTEKQYQDMWTMFSGDTIEMVTAFSKLHNAFVWNSTAGVYELDMESEVAEMFEESGMAAVSLQFVDGKLYSAAFSLRDAEFGMDIELQFTKYGTTSVTLPTQFTDGEYSGGGGSDKPTVDGSVAGKSYTFVGYESNDCDPETLEQMNQQMSAVNIVFYFNDDNTFRLVMESSEGEVIMTGTYAQEGNRVTVTPQSQSVNGGVIEEAEGLEPMDGYVEGNRFVLVEEVPPYGGSAGYTVYMIYKF